MIEIPNFDMERVQSIQDLTILGTFNRELLVEAEYSTMLANLGKLREIWDVLPADGDYKGMT